MRTCQFNLAAIECGVPDPFARKTYLHAVPDAALPIRFSLGKRVRALQLQAYLKGLEETAVGVLGPGAGLELIVLTPSDWRRQLSAPYGWGLTRRSEAGVSVALPATYPPRLIARWDAVRLRAARAGVRAPGSVTSFLDANLGLEWAHARLLGEAVESGKRPKAWLRELSACYLYQRVLWQQNDSHKLGYLSAWARLEQAGTREPDRGQNPEPDKETDYPVGPQDFVYPRGKMPLEHLLAAQGALWLQAAALGETDGWDLSTGDVQARGKEILKGRLETL